MLPTQQRFLDILDYHSTVQQAAATASRCGVKTLVLTHYVPAPPPRQEDEWRALAAEHFAGEIVVGPDLTVIER
jgi:ribonuclease Z